MSTPSGGYYGGLGTYFGAEVDLLEALDAENPIHRYIRKHSLATLERVFSAPGPLLEIGYGTGFEAVHLAKRGFKVVGIDPSEAMQKRAKTRAAEAGVADLVDFRVASTGDLRALAEEFGAEHFRGAYSTLGPFNCEPDLKGAATSLGRLLPAGAPLAAMIINRYCVWESALYLSAGNFKKAFRRQVRGWADLHTEPEGIPIPVFTYTPTSFSRAFESDFALSELFALPVALPPPYVAARFKRLGGLLSVLENADLRIRERPIPRALGDHFEVVLRRRETAAP